MMTAKQRTLGSWVRNDKSKAIGVRVDCYVAVYLRFAQQNPVDFFEFLTERNPYGPPSPIAPPGSLLQVAVSAYGRWAPGWTQQAYDKTYLLFLQTPKCQARINLLREVAKNCVVFLVGLAKNPRIYGRTLVKRLIETTGAAD